MCNNFFLPSPRAIFNQTKIKNTHVKDLRLCTQYYLGLCLLQCVILQCSGIVTKYSFTSTDAQINTPDLRHVEVHGHKGLGHALVHRVEGRGRRERVGLGLI